MNLIQISLLFNVTVDYLVKDDECSKGVACGQETDMDQLAEFLLEAARNTYAGYGPECESSRPDSHDYRYEKDDYLFIDTYIGGECFSGEEAIWKSGKPVFAMNYSGRTLDETFSGNFLKEALRAATKECPFRGPALYQSGEYSYRSNVQGDMTWFQGYEEIYFHEKRVYECYYHGGIVK